MRQQIAEAEANKHDLPVSSHAAELAAKDMDFSEYFGQASAASSSKRFQHRLSEGSSSANHSTGKAD